MTGSSLALATKGLRKSYGSRLALDGLDLSVPTGVVYGFLGPNGAGKTTTMRVLTGLIHPDGGSIELLGRPFTGRDRHRLFDVGALVETPAFYPYLSGRAQPPALAASGAKVPARRIDEVLDIVGLRERSSDKVSRYSLGMKQRLGIAGALLNDPTLLLLDEPANGLDPAGIVAMRETLRHLASIGKTVFISSHLLAEVQQMADVVGIIACGPPRPRGLDAGAAGVGGHRPHPRPARRGPGRGGDARSPDHAGTRLGPRIGHRLDLRPDHPRPFLRGEPRAGPGRHLRGRDEHRQRPRGAVPDPDRRRRARPTATADSPRSIDHPPALPFDGGPVMRLFVSGLQKLATRMATLLTFGLLAGLLVMIDLAVATTRGARLRRRRQSARPRHVPGRLRPDPELPLRPRRPVRRDLRRGDRRLGMDLGHPQDGRGPRREPQPLPARDVRGHRGRHGGRPARRLRHRCRGGRARIGDRRASRSTGSATPTALAALPEHFARGWVAITATAALGFAVATLARSQLAGIGVGIAFYFGETFAGIFLPDVVRYLPFHLSQAAVGGRESFGGPPDPGALSVGTALFLVTLWLVGSLVVAAGFSERAEITG